MYARFSEVYDRLMDDIDYEAWAQYLLRLLGAMGVVPGSACDCGCGTGSLTFALKKRGLVMTGVDISEEMLMHAAEKSRALGVRIPFIKQDMCTLSLHRPVDAIFCAIDGVNYLLSKARVKAFFEAAHGQLTAGGALAFDVSTRKKLMGMSGALYFEERDDLSYFWQNTYDPASHMLDMELTFFLRRKDGLYERFVEHQRQRAHTIKELEGLLFESGFSTVRAYGDRTDELPGPDDERIFIVAVKDQ